MRSIHISLPPQVKTALDRLQAAGHAAFAVGGCVRDTLLGKTPNDWDITTSARPEETSAVFFDLRRIENGIKHGTLTVILDGMPLEITTFRNDGEYADNRHPIQVTFSDTVEDDLARRDFTVNAMAYSPDRGIVDLFGGAADLDRRIIACVGDPSTRFGEDGLRILRALRFASVLDFSIDPATRDAIHACSQLLDNIAAERIREEFCKLIPGRGAVRILREYRDVIAQFMPELAPCFDFEQNSKYHCYDVWEHTLHAIEPSEPDLSVRLALLFHDIGKPHCYTEDADGGHFKGHAQISLRLSEDILRRLRFDNATTEEILALVERHDLPLSSEPRLVKRLMQRLPDRTILRLLEIQRCDRLAHAEGYETPPAVLDEIPRVMQQIRAADECLSLKSLAVKGNDLMEIGVPAGKQLGALLEHLLNEVLDESLPNDREALLSAARAWLQ